ncbi:MAG: beta-ketoacyl-[acyl-carrier-protein] synthase family protein [Verrucomicrobia bacterium]|nr:beta-ketoacyl-[acyl-carrier-protein] synthase family protein [Verrucomicrobiota bacterium]
MSHRVVITGLGLCTPVGCGVEEFWRNLLAGRSGIGPITLFDASSFPVRIGGEVKDLDMARLAGTFPKAAGEKDRKIWLGLEAVSQAMADARLTSELLRDAPLFVGVSLESFFLERVAPVAHEEDPALAFVDCALAQRTSDRLQTPLDRTTQLIGDHYGLNHGRYTNCSACAAGAQVIGEAFRRLRDGVAAVAVAGATDSVLNPLGLGGFSLLHILSTENDQPQRACRPFDATRQGTVLSEGAAFVVLETLAHAQHRGARAYAEVLGYGSSLDAFRVTDPEPNGRGAALSMRRAMADAGLKPEEVDGVSAHGTGTPKNDVAETLAIKQALGARAGEVPVTANKSMTGHLIAASGAVEAVAMALTLSARKIPPTINLEHPDPQCDLDYVAGGSRDFAGRTALSNSFGFGGQNATLVFRRLDS